MRFESIASARFLFRHENVIGSGSSTLTVLYGTISRQKVSLGLSDDILYLVLQPLCVQLRSGTLATRETASKIYYNISIKY
jgi:hypothetical protein